MTTFAEELQAHLDADLDIRARITGEAQDLIQRVTAGGQDRKTRDLARASGITDYQIRLMRDGRTDCGPYFYLRLASAEAALDAERAVVAPG